MVARGADPPRAHCTEREANPLARPSPCSQDPLADKRASRRKRAHLVLGVALLVHGALHRGPQPIRPRPRPRLNRRLLAPAAHQQGGGGGAGEQHRPAGGGGKRLPRPSASVNGRRRRGGVGWGGEGERQRVRGEERRAEGERRTGGNSTPTPRSYTGRGEKQTRRPPLFVRRVSD